MSAAHLLVWAVRAHFDPAGAGPFGHKIVQELAGHGVDVSHISFTDQANTALAFVESLEGGRKPHLQLLPQTLRRPFVPAGSDPAGVVQEAFALHFCSVSLVDSPMRYAHLAAIAAARGGRGHPQF